MAKTTRYQTTEYNRSERLLRRLRDIYSCARSYHMTHRQILDTITAEIYQTRDFKKLRPYYRGMFDATHYALNDALYRYHLEWRVRLDGKLIPSKEVLAGRWSDVQMGEYVWTDAPDKLFSTPEPQKAD